MIVTHRRLISRTKNEITTEYTYREPGRKKEKKMLLTYTYVEPKTKEEKEERERRLSSALAPIFEETLKEWSQRKKGTAHKGKKA